jgi:hypothetical protein
MKTLHFKTNIDCPFQIEKALCALECLHGRYCHLSIDLTAKNCTLTLKSNDLQSDDIITLLKRQGINCQTLPKFS